jgi:hypothetical protein
MHSKDIHISDHELLLAADAELDAPRASEVRSHLDACEPCRERLRNIEQTSANFATAYRQSTEPESLSDPARARMALRRSLAQTSQPAAWLADFANAFAFRKWAYNAAFVAVALLSVGVVYRYVWLPNSGGAIAQVQAAPLPKPNLTPGATLGPASDVCSAARIEDASRIPVSERKEVFREYGMDYRRAGQYELDHLITPALGGTDDIHNLWPEPYGATEWNAHVKDQLENLLHQMVCSGQIDLPTAQRAIATNWIEAYKHYFHTDKPLTSFSAAGDADDDDDRSSKS